MSDEILSIGLELNIGDVIYKKEYRKCALNEQFRGLNLIYMFLYIGSMLGGALSRMG